METTMIIKERAENTILVMALEGRLDAFTAATFKDRIKTLFASGPVRLVMDLANLRFLNSSGLSVLVSTLRMAIQAGGDVRIARLKPEMKSLFALTQLNKVFEIHESVESATAAFGHGQVRRLPHLVLPQPLGEQPLGRVLDVRTVPA